MSTEPVRAIVEERTLTWRTVTAPEKALDVADRASAGASEPTAPEPSTGSFFARLGRSVAIYSALGTATAFGVAKCTEEKLRAETRETYGTFDQPKFQVREGEWSDAVRPVEQLLVDCWGSRSPDDIDLSVKFAEIVIPDFQRTFTELEQIVSARELSPNQFAVWRDRFEAAAHPRIMETIEFEEAHPQFAASCEALRALGEAAELNAMELESRALTRDLEELSVFSTLAGIDRGLTLELGPAYSSIDYAKEIFGRVTGSEPPKSIVVTVADIPEPGVVGTSLCVGEAIVIEPQGFAQEVSTLCHEMGHLIARPGEEFDGRGGLLGEMFLGRTRERIVKVLEEASAYSFERLCVSAIPDPRVRALAVRSFEGQLVAQTRGFFRGHEDIHNEAGVVAAAAVRVLGSPKAAFDYLSSTHELSPEILRAIDDVREVWRTLPSTQCRDAATELREVKRKVELLRAKVDPGYDR